VRKFLTSLLRFVFVFLGLAAQELRAGLLFNMWNIGGLKEWYEGITILEVYADVNTEDQHKKGRSSSLGEFNDPLRTSALTSPGRWTQIQAHSNRQQENVHWFWFVGCFVLLLLIRFISHWFLTVT
jgi:hypothetical protein